MQEDSNIHGFFFHPPLFNNYWGHIFEELYKEKIYAPFVENTKLKTCVEIGGNVGLVTYYFSQYFDKVYVLEPSLEHFDLLTRMISFNKLINVIPIRKALFTQDLSNGESLPFFHNKNKTMYSLHQAVNDNSSKPEQVECIRLDTLFKQQSIEHVDLLKLDIEGSEIEVLSGEGFQNVADLIDTIIIERHNWSGRHPNQLNQALEKANFLVSTIKANADIIIGKKK